MSVRTWLILPPAVVIATLLGASPASADVSADPPTAAFTPVAVGDTGNGSITLQSDPGDADGPNISSFTTSDDDAGADCAMFILPTNLLPHQLGGGGDIFEIPLSFTPTARGSFSCTVNVFDDGSNLVTTFTMTGSGVAPVMQVSETSLLFADTRVQGGSTILSFDIKNTSTDVNQNLDIPTIAISGSGAAAYSLDNSSANIGPGDSTTINVTFDPSTATTLTATITITPQDTDIDPATITLTGTGTTAILNVSPSTFDFGSIRAGTTSGATNVTVSNTGTTDFTIDTAILTQTDGWFQFTAQLQVNCAGSTTSCGFLPVLDIGSNQTIGIVCAPPANATGSSQATLTFDSTADSPATESTVFTCAATNPSITVSSVATIDFGTQRVGVASSGQNVTIGNTGNADLIVSLEVGGTDSQEYAITGDDGCVNNCAISANSSAVFSLSFTPAAVGERDAIFIIESNDPVSDNDVFEIPLKGTGIEPDILQTAPATTSVDFGDVKVGVSSIPAVTVTVENTGTATLSISSAGVATTEFTVSGTLTAQTVAPNGNAQWLVQCHPDSRGSKSDSFTITSDAANTPSLVIPLTCNGINGELSVSPTSIDFGGVDLGQQSSQSFTLTNIGELTVTLNTPTLSGSGVGYTIAAPDTLTLASGAHVDVPVTFSPVNDGDGGSETAIVTSNANTIDVPLTGQGQSVGIDVTTSTLDFSDVRWDQTSQKTFDIRNTGVVSFNVTSVSLTETADFQLIGITQDGSPVSPPFLLAAGDSVTVTVQADPNATMLGLFTGAVQVTCDLPTDDTRSIALSVNSTAPEVTIDGGSTVNFGGVDIHEAAGSTITVKLHNTGTAPLNIDDEMTTGAQFSATTTTLPTTVAVNGEFDVQVTYKPTAEEMAANGDQGFVLLDVDGLFPMDGTAPSSIKLTLTGQGTDRHLSLNPTSIQFPDTPRNPTTSPIQAITITNTGAATLDLSAVTLTGDAVFKLLDTPPTAIAGGASTLLHISFTPTAENTDYTSVLEISHDDTSFPEGLNVMVPVTGRGVGRDVVIAPTMIDFGITPVGVPVTLSKRGGQLTLTNQSATPIAVRAIQLVDSTGLFTISGNDAQTLAPAATMSIDLTFSPTAEGVFNASVEIYFDQDPVAAAVVPVVGTSVGVHVHGSGCSATGDDNSEGNLFGAALVVLFGLLTMMARRRRGLIVVGTAAIALLSATAARAQSVNGSHIDVSTFQPAVGVADEMLEVHSAELGDVGHWAASFGLGYATNPLQIDLLCGAASCPSGLMSGGVDRPVSSQTLATLGFAYVLSSRLELAAFVPLLSQSGDANTIGVAPASGGALGDIGVRAKVGLLHRGDWTTSFGAGLTFPTASDNQFAGTGGVAGELEGYQTWRHDLTTVSANVGVLLRGTATFGDVRQGTALTYGAGATYRFAPKWLAGGELFGDSTLVSKSGSDSPLQLLAEARYQVGPALAVSFGIGGGIIGGIGAASVRGFLSLTYSPGSGSDERNGPTLEEFGRLDDDHDGILNKDDKCPEDPEDKDGFQDADGCPDPDNDNDGIPDVLDKCPNQPEDKDGFQDADGCPDPDNDGDGIPDVSDKCPNEPEDKDGFQDADGCPDPDNDGDGIPDALDKCPDEPETINGINDEDGCPDVGESMVLLLDNEIQTLDSVRFIGSTFKPTSASYNLLGQVASTVRAHPEITTLHIIVHVNAHDTHDQELSNARAQVIHDWLVQWGLAPGRVDAIGMGSTKMLVPKTDRSADTVNNRVQFTIEKRK